MSVFSGNSQKLLDELSERLFRSKGSEEKLKSAVTDEDRINVVLKDDFVMDQLRMYVKGFRTEGRFSKSREKSNLYRQKGNTQFEDKDIAMKCYWQAIAYAPDKSHESRLAYGNRSALNFRKKYYEECVKDIDFALEGEESDLRRLKLLVRRGKAQLKLETHQKALDTFKEAKSVIARLPESNPTVSRFVDSVDVGLTEARSKEEPNPKAGKSDCWKDRTLPWLAGGENPSFPSASSSLAIRESKAKGKHVVAIKPVKMGDILFVEKPVAFVVLPEFSIEKCHHCCKYLSNPLPCTKCAAGSYCSVECRQGAWEAYHRYECGPGLDLAYSLGIAHLGLRLTLLGAHLGQSSPKYQQILKLVHHLPHAPIEDLAQYAISAALLGVYLETCTDYLKSGIEGRAATLESVCGSLLCHIGQMICNGHAIMGLANFKEPCDLLIETEVRHATAIYPSASMMNHSCDSNIMNTFEDQYLIVRATRDIGVGEEVYNCYGPHFRRMLRAERQKALKEQYNFVCQCPPCSAPFSSQYQQRFLAYRCKFCSGPILKDSVPLACLDCHQKTDLPSILSLLTIAGAFYKEAEEDISQNVEDALMKYIETLKIYNTVYYKYHKDVGNCKDKIARCYAELLKYEKSYKYLEENLVIVREQFGEGSSEFALEVFKLSDICASLVDILPKYSFRPKAEETLNYIQRAKKTIEMFYGKRNSKYQEIKILEEELMEFMARDTFKEVDLY